MKKVILSIALLINMLYAKSYPSLLYNGNCTACHFKTQAVSAPSIKEIRENYLRAFPNKKDFVAYMSQWVYAPKKETSIMQDAIEKYEIMPTLAYDKETLEIIAEYIYDTEF